MYKTIVLISCFIFFAKLSFQNPLGVGDIGPDDQTVWKNDPLCYPNYSISFFPVPEDCSQYYRCYLGDKYLLECPKGQWWHQEIKMCDKPGKYCEATTYSPSASTPSSPSTVTPDSTPGSPSTVRPDSTPSSVTPPLSTPSTSGTTNINPTSENPHVDPRCVDGNTNYWPHPQLCHRYIECYRQSSYEMACPKNLYFSDKKKECVNADESECCQKNLGYSCV